MDSSLNYSSINSSKLMNFENQNIIQNASHNPSKRKIKKSIDEIMI